MSSQNTRYKYVEPAEEDGCTAQKVWLRNYVQAAENSVFAANYADPENGYAKEVAYLRNWVEGRLQWLDTKVPSPPNFNQSGGSVPVGFNLEMREESGFPAFPGEVHYTMDGNDPAAPGSTPFIYVSPLALNENARVFARTKNATKGTWDPGV